MNLYLLRHAIAVDRAACTRDELRPLTREGIQKLRAVIRGMSRLELKFDAIATSSYLRALQTAQQVAVNLRFPGKMRQTAALEPGARPEALVQFLSALDPAPENMLLVGHEPDLSELVGLFVFGRSNAGIRFKKAGLCKLEVDRLKTGRCALLAWLLTPRQLSLLA